MMKEENPQEMRKMDALGTLESEDGKIAFLGMIRALDQGVNEFQIDLPGRSSMYGEWLPLYQPNGYDLNVDILSFGYADKSNVGNPHSAARGRFSRGEKAKIQNLIRLIFSNSGIRDKVFPFAVRGSNFLGSINFRNGWILEE